jgi:hypothetical protein
MFVYILFFVLISNHRGMYENIFVYLYLCVYAYVWIYAYVQKTFKCIYAYLINYNDDDDDDVYLIEKLQHVGYKIYLLTDQSGRHKYKMNSNQQINK